MCAPMIGMAAGIAGSVGSGIGAASAANSQAAVSEYNAITHDINAITKRQQGLSEADQKQDKNKRELAAQRVAAAGSGIDISSGSAARVIDQETTKNNWLDEMQIIWNRGTEAIAEENEAQVERARAKAQRSAAGTSMLTGIVQGIGAGAKYATRIA